MMQGELLDRRYQISQLIGEGGFGKVYLAQDLATGQSVAVKVLQDLDNVSRFEREVRIISELRSPHTVRLYGHGRTPDGFPYVVVEYLDGEDLSAMLSREGTLDEGTIEHIARQLLQALAEAHSKGILHRDIKPENIRIVRQQDFSISAKLLDFGIARRADGAPKLTATGELLGTYRYMSPEQLTDGRVTPASDLYSLGLVILEMLSGRSALQGGSLGAQIDRLVEGHTFPIPPGTSARLSAVLTKLLAQNRRQRFRSAAAVLAQLDGESGRVSQTSAQSGTGGHGWALVGVALVALLAVPISVFWSQEPARPHTVNSGVRDVRGLTGGGTNAPRTRAAPRDLSVSRDVASRDATAAGCGTAQETGLIAVDGGLLHVPGSYKPDVPHPVVIALAPQGTIPSEFFARSGLEPLAEDEAFLVLVPDQTTPSLVPKAVAPNAGGDWDVARSSSDLRSTVDSLNDGFCIDPDAVFALGFITGGRVAAALACEPWIAAAASYSARPREPVHRGCQFQPPPKPFLLFSGIKTQHAPVNGGVSCDNKHRISLAMHEEIWLDRNRCLGEPRSHFRRGADQCFTWSCDDAPFVSCRVDAGHNWPGAPPRWRDVLNCDGPTTDFPAANVAWDFFSKVRSTFRVPTNELRSTPSQ